MSKSDLTKQALASAFKKLVATKPYDQVTISEICALCGLNRKSFYYHFKDKYDLGEWIFQTECVDTTQVSTDDADETLWAVLRHICTHLYAERNFYTKILTDPVAHDGFYRYLFTLLCEFFNKYIDEYYQPTDQTQHEPRYFYVQMVSDAVLSAICRWLIDDGAVHTPDDLIAQAKSMLNYATGLNKNP